jgi:toxin ParE1/3/4
VTSPAVFAPAARADLRQAVAWICRDNPAAARALRDVALRGFPYVMVYAAGTIPPRILRVLHTARDLPAILAELPPLQ